MRHIHNLTITSNAIFHRIFCFDAIWWGIVPLVFVRVTLDFVEMETRIASHRSNSSKYREHTHQKKIQKTGKIFISRWICLTQYAGWTRKENAHLKKNIYIFRKQYNSVLLLLSRCWQCDSSRNNSGNDCVEFVCAFADYAETNEVWG